MNDITKARHFLKLRRSELETISSFGLMMATAEKRYRDIKMRQSINADVPGTWDVQEVEAALDYAVLRYLKKHNQLPSDVTKAFSNDVTLEDKRALAQKWATN